jgi:hypothetical protein
MDREATKAQIPRPKSDRGLQFNKPLKFHGRSGASEVPQPLQAVAGGSFSRPQ